MAGRVSAVLALCLLVGVIAGCGYQVSRQSNSRNETCAKCGSYRYYTVITHRRGPLKRTQVKTDLAYKSPHYDTCKHVWKHGEECIGGRIWNERGIFLIKKGKALGALVPHERREGVFDFRWYYRSDGKATFRDGRYRTGTTTLTAKEGEYPYGVVPFGPFKVTWLGIGAKYARAPSEKVGRNDQKLACPQTTDIRQVDAAQYYFYGSDTDAGVLWDGSPGTGG